MVSRCFVTHSASYSSSTGSYMLYAVGNFRLVEPHSLARPFRFRDTAARASVWEEALEVLQDGQTLHDDGAVAVDKGRGFAPRVDEGEVRASGFLG